jgi:DNA-binding response OmpR family regulator
MPKMNGIEMLKQLRAADRFASVPVVMLTAAADVAHVSDAIALNASDYVRKDLPVTELMNRMQKHLASL